MVPSSQRPCKVPKRLDWPYCRPGKTRRHGASEPVQPIHPQLVVLSASNASWPCMKPSATTIVGLRGVRILAQALLVHHRIWSAGKKDTSSSYLSLFNRAQRRCHVCKPPGQLFFCLLLLPQEHQGCCACRNNVVKLYQMGDSWPRFFDSADTSTEQDLCRNQLEPEHVCLYM